MQQWIDLRYGEHKNVRIMSANMASLNALVMRKAGLGLDKAQLGMENALPGNY